MTRDNAKSSGWDPRMVWLLVAAGLAFTLSLAGAALKTTVAVDFVDITASLQTTVSGMAWSTTIFAAGIAVASPLVGMLADRWGGSAVLMVGTLLAGVAFLVCAATHEVVLFALAYGILGSLAFTMLSYVPLGKLADELFAGRGEGLAYAAMTNGPAVGFIVLVPLWVWLGTFMSWQTVFVITGVLMIVALTPLGLLVGRVSARRVGDEDDAPAAIAVVEPVRMVATEQLRSVLTHRHFVIIALAFGGCGVTMGFVDVHLVNDLRMAGMHGDVVSGTLSLLGLFELIGSLLAGRLCDRGLIRQTLVVGYALRGLAMLFLVAEPVTATALGFGIVFGASYMVTVVATTIWVMRLLPPGVRATGMGLIWLVHQVGAALSSQLGAYARQRSGSYGPLSLIEAGVVLISMLAVIRLPAPPAAHTEQAHPSPSTVADPVIPGRETS